MSAPAKPRPTAQQRPVRMPPAHQVVFETPSMGFLLPAQGRPRTVLVRQCEHCAFNTRSTVGVRPDLIAHWCPIRSVQDELPTLVVWSWE